MGIFLQHYDFSRHQRLHGTCTRGMSGSLLRVEFATDLHAFCQCRRGYTGQRGGPCLACELGKYKALNGSSPCLWCSAAKHASRVAATTCDDCSVCPSGFWSNCTVQNGGGCAACSQKAQPIVFLSAGRLRIPSALIPSPPSSSPGGNHTCVNSSNSTSSSNSSFSVAANFSACISNHSKPRTGVNTSNLTAEERQNIFDEAWITSHNCTKTTVFEWGPWTQIMKKQCYDSLDEPNSCMWRCDTGHFLDADGFCQPCNSSLCDVGHYRGQCTLTHDGDCVPCTNPLPNSTVYATAGIPFDQDACGIRCADGLYPTVDLATLNLTNESDLSQAVCAACSAGLSGSSKPDAAHYSGASLVVNVPYCPWECDEGYVQDGMTCILIDLDSSCPLGACPLPKLVYKSDASVTLSNPCYEWQYANCSEEGTVTCSTCLGVTSTMQGGHILYTSEPCPIGHYRSPCKNRCVFPDGGNVRGQCVKCSNARTRHANYTSPGVLSNTALPATALLHLRLIAHTLWHCSLITPPLKSHIPARAYPNMAPLAHMVKSKVLTSVMMALCVCCQACHTRRTIANGPATRPTVR